MAVRLAPQFMAMEVTGWLQRRGNELSVQGIPVELPAEYRPLTGRRVTLVGSPQTSARGQLKSILRITSVVQARKQVMNGCCFRGLGSLRCVDVSEQLIRLRIYRNGRSGETFGIRLRATASFICAVPPEWSQVMVEGELIGPLLVVTRVSSYSPQHWRTLPVPWVEQWQVNDGTSGTSSAVIVQSAAGRYFSERQPMKRERFDALLRAGKVWPSVD